MTHTYFLLHISPYISISLEFLYFVIPTNVRQWYMLTKYIMRIVI